MRVLVFCLFFFEFENHRITFIWFIHAHCSIHMIMLRVVNILQILHHQIVRFQSEYDECKVLEIISVSISRVNLQSLSFNGYSLNRGGSQEQINPNPLTPLTPLSSLSAYKSKVVKSQSSLCSYPWYLCKLVTDRVNNAAAFSSLQIHLRTFD